MILLVKSYCATVDVPSDTVTCGQCSNYNGTLATCSVDRGSEVDSDEGWTTIHSKSRLKKGKSEKTKEPFQVVLFDGIDLDDCWKFLESMGLINV